MLLYGSDIWVVTGEMLKFLGGFHHQADRHITGMTETHGAGKEWEYAPVVASLEAAGLNPIMYYIMRRQATIAEKMAFCPIYEL